MKKTLFLLTTTIFLFYGCTSNDLNKRMDKLTARMDSFEKNPFGVNLHPESRQWEFQWVALGKDGHHIIDKHFYISNINTSFKDNGFKVSGTIGNVTSMTITNAIVECAIKDTTTKEMVISGNSDAPTLYSGAKATFNVFIPTTKTNVAEIGILVRDYRM